MSKPTTRSKAQRNPLYLREEELRQAIELLFFAYRDFTGEADAILEEFGFGRAHHRIIYFVGANPAITISELLMILKITKQSLSRVLGQLIDEAFIFQKTDSIDRRRRQLFLTAKGKSLEETLTKYQSKRIAKAYRLAGGDAVDGFCTVLRGITNDIDHASISNDGYE